MKSGISITKFSFHSVLLQVFCTVPKWQLVIFPLSPISCNIGTVSELGWGACVHLILSVRKIKLLCSMGPVDFWDSTIFILNKTNSLPADIVSSTCKESSSLFCLISFVALNRLWVILYSCTPSSSKTRLIVVYQFSAASTNQYSATLSHHSLRMGTSASSGGDTWTNRSIWSDWRKTF